MQSSHRIISIGTLAAHPLWEERNDVRTGHATTTLIERYFQGKIRETWEYSRIVVEQSAMKDAGALFEEMNQALLVGRNEDWEPKIASLVDGKNAVIAVGAAHLSGEDGVVRSLERAGYQITTVYP